MNSKAIKKLAAGWFRWAKDMTIFVATFWALSAGGWYLANKALDATIYEINASERVGLDAQGRGAWDAYCVDVFVKHARQDDLDAIYAECSAHEWDADAPHG